MFYEERINKIKTLLLEKDAINISHLATLLNVSEVTIRRDINRLEEEGFLIKTQGGAVLAKANTTNSLNKEVYIVEETITNYEYKNRIAEMAAAIIEENDSVFLGEGTTCYLLSKKMKKFNNITLVTNNLSACLELAPYIKNIYLIGGELIRNRGNLYTGGPKVASNLSTVFVNKAFVSSNGFDVNIGFTIQELSQLNILSYLPKFASRIISMIDYKKFGIFSVHQLAPADFADIIITNKEVDLQYQEILSRKNIKLLTC